MNLFNRMVCKSLVGLALTTSVLFFASCHDSSSGSDVEITKPSDDSDKRNSCEEKYDVDFDAVWEDFYSDNSYIKKEICNRTESMLNLYMNVTCEGVELNKGSSGYIVYVNDGGTIRKLYTKHSECSFRFTDESAYPAIISDMGAFTFSSCLCKVEDGTAMFRNADDEVSPKSSSSKAKMSSSSVKSSSSSGQSSSSSVVSSSSVETVVCTETKSVQLDSPFVAAYEFYDVDNLGADYFGKNNAVIGGGFPRGDCDNLILDGKSGLKIPLSDIFKSKGFIVEARVYPEAFNTMQNILVSEPPGSSYSGWQLRLDNGVVAFHLRDYSKNYSNWTIYKAGKIPLNEWSVIRVERYPTGKVIVQVNGNTLVEEIYEGNVVNESYDLGLGFDAMGQDRSSERFFVGKMDYVRFGIIKDENGVEPVSAEPRLIEDETTGRMKVAAIDENLACSEQEEDESYQDFAVAYEFNDIGDLGRDFMGKNHAVYGVGVPDGDCSSLVLDGKSGLRIPLSDDFMSKGIDINVRFMLTDVSGTSVLFGSSPEFAGNDGWRISVTNGKVKFDAKDYQIGDGWTSLELESIEENQWMEVRVKIFPAKSELDGVIFYSLNVRIDKYLRQAAEFKADLSQLGSDLSIGYNLLNGGAQFAKGKIDFVRFKALSEEGLSE